ncbi:hypothetical protein DTL70_24135 [Streptomyces diacarni]|uniref:Uncharacterized protein n=1 Tax=Streptomyces diacarni TaxID=2800381 RepID=A0A367ERI6_9ACTN|nr:hypothetical protein [Streptomyces diacarni]RCG19800.1 hypothetical protein DTL70_24135 [Streptomyces diacarni]
MGEDSAPRESVAAGYEDVASYFRQHQQQEGHQARRARTSFGAPAFLVPSGDGSRRVTCCRCMHG